MKVVLDTNVLFAAFTVEHGFCANVMVACLNRFDLVLSEHILEELRRHLTGKGSILAAKVDEILVALCEASSIVTPAPLPLEACRDTSDVAILGTAIAGAANVIISGDKDLLVMKSFEGVQILSPREFSERFLSAQ